MKDKTLNFDNITYYVENYVNANSEEVFKMKSDLIDKIYSPLRKYIGEKISKKNGQNLLIQCAEIAEKCLEDICKKKSVDFWLTFIRRFPNKTAFFDSDPWKIYATLAIIKWSNWEEDTTLGHLEMNNTFAVKLVLTPDELDDCLKIAIISELLASIVNFHRRLGKGAKLIVDKGVITAKGSKIVEEAMLKYDRRRPKGYILAEEGTPTKIFSKSNDLDSKIIISFFLPNPFPIYFPKNDFTLYMMNHFFNFIDLEAIIATLNLYENAIKSKFGAGVKCIAQTLYSLSRNIQTTIPLWKLLKVDNNKLVCPFDAKDDKFSHQIRFLFQFCQKGILRFPEAHFRKKLSEYVFSPMVSNKDEAQELVNQFFDSFLLKAKEREGIDLLRLNPIPMIYTSPGGNCYFDLNRLYDFLRHIIDVSKHWLSLQHGDQFTLMVNDLIAQEAANVKILAGKETFTTSVGKKAEVDILIKKGSIIYAIECKAHTKSRDFWIGSADKVRNRTSEINKAVKQAQNTVQVLKKCIKEKIIELPEHSMIQWIVCTPTQEYICPFDKYGLLTNEIPRVCTHEELIDFLNK